MKHGSASKMREVYYNNIAGQLGYKRRCHLWEFAQKAVASLPVRTHDNDVFFGVNMKNGGAFQTIHEKSGRYYAELVLNKGAEYKYLHCQRTKIVELFAVAWRHSAPDEFLAATSNTKWRTRHAVDCYQKPPSPRPDNFTVSGIMKKRRLKSRLGHGDHWRAVHDAADDELYQREFDEKIMGLVAKITKQCERVDAVKSPWVKKRGQKLLQYELDEDGSSLKFSAIELIQPASKQLLLLSAFPVLPQSCPWILQLDEVANSYGDYEGLVSGQAANGHGLKWFAPDFLRYAHEWSKGGVVAVQLSGLALTLEKYDAKPLKITEGPLLEEERQRLRNEGKTRAAARLKHVTVHMGKMRTLYSTANDHAVLVGRVLEKREIRAKTWREIRGHILEIEVLNGELPTGYILPVYTFPATLGAYRPRRGDLVTGSVWLQGRYGHAATDVERAQFAKLSEEN